MGLGRPADKELRMGANRTGGVMYDRARLAGKHRDPARPSLPVGGGGVGRSPEAATLA